MEFIVSVIRRFWENRFIRFLFVGGINTLFGYGVFSLLILLKVYYPIALFLATVMGVVFNYFTIGRIVFRRKGREYILRFVSVYAVVYFFNLGLLKLLNQVFYLNILISQIICLFPVVLLNYFLQKRIVFR